MAARVYPCTIKVRGGREVPDANGKKTEQRWEGEGEGIRQEGKTRIPRVEARPGALGGTMKAGCTISSFGGIQDRARDREIVVGGGRTDRPVD